jgi:hypothetical protein
MTKPRSIDERFWGRVQKTEGCWIWIGYLDKAGYGRIQRGKRNLAAHRLSFELHFGSIPDGLCVCHRCDNPACVHPDHLFLGTHQDNMEDSRKKGRKAKKLTLLRVRLMRDLRAQGASLKSLARKFNVSGVTVSTTASGKNWKE